MTAIEYFERMSPEELEECREIMWRDLAKHGIYNEEQLDEAIEKLPPLPIGFFFEPMPWLSEEKKAELARLKERYTVPRKKNDTGVI